MTLNHPLDWTCADVGNWLLQAIPQTSATTIQNFRSKGIDGVSLWYSEPSHFSTMNMTLDELRSLFNAISALKQKFEYEDILHSLLLQEKAVNEDDEVDLDFRLCVEALREDWDQLRLEIFDSSCCARLAHQYSKDVENFHSDALLARSLQIWEISDNPASVQLGRKLEQERLDGEFAQRLSNGAAVAQGEIVEPLPENSDVVIEQVSIMESHLLSPSAEILSEESVPSRRSSITDDVDLADSSSLTHNEPDLSPSLWLRLDEPSAKSVEQSPAKCGGIVPAATETPSKPDKLFHTKDSCTGCLEVTTVARLGCSHSMCRDCLTTLFRTATSDRSLLPARCCQQRIPMELAATTLPPNELARLVQRTREAQARSFMHCPVPACSAFIELDAATLASPSPRLECPSCLAAACMTCRTAWHAGATCDASRAAQELEAVAVLARERGWRRCAGCAVFVSLTQGCNHMTCACGHGFCYACGAAWKTCGCELWSREHQLYAENERVAAEAAEQREVLRRPLAAQEMAAVRQRVRRVFEHEERHGECEHADRSYESGRHFGQCQRCGWTCNIYGFRCADCRLVFCRTCHYHRM